MEPVLICLSLTDWDMYYTLITGMKVGTNLIRTNKDGIIISLLASPISQEEKRLLRAIIKKIEPDLLALKETCDSITDDKSKDQETKDSEIIALKSKEVGISLAKIPKSNDNILFRLACDEDYSMILDNLYE